MSAKQDEKQIHRAVGVRNLPVPLDDAAKIRVGAELAQAEIELNDAAVTFAAVRATFNGERKTLEETIQTLAKTLESGEEMKDIECFEELDLKKKLVRLIRQDTLVTVSERDAEAGELQGILFGSEQ